MIAKVQYIGVRSTSQITSIFTAIANIIMDGKCSNTSRFPGVYVNTPIKLILLQPEYTC